MQDQDAKKEGQLAQNISQPIATLTVTNKKAEEREEIRRPEERRMEETERKRKDAEERRKTGSVFVIKATSSAGNELASAWCSKEELFLTVLSLTLYSRCLSSAKYLTE